MTTRRDFLKGLFSGVVLVGAGVGGTIIYQGYDHYYAPGKYNIWRSYGSRTA